MVRASDCQCQSRMQHPSTHGNLRGARFSSVEWSTWQKPKKKCKKMSLISWSLKISASRHLNYIQFCIDSRLGTTGRSVPLSLQAMRRWREASANVLYECDWMIDCMYVIKIWKINKKSGILPPNLYLFKLILLQQHSDIIMNRKNWKDVKNIYSRFIQELNQQCIVYTV